MIFPYNATMSTETKTYLQKSIKLHLLLNFFIFVLGIVTIVLIVTNPNSKERSIVKDDTGTELIKLNKNILSAQKEYQEELKKSDVESRKQTDETNVQLQSIHSDLKGYKNQSDAKVDRITKFTHDDIIGEFSKLERQHKDTSKSAENSTTDY